jgi:hypothetical protein
MKTISNDQNVTVRRKFNKIAEKIDEDRSIEKNRLINNKDRFYHTYDPTTQTTIFRKIN